MRRFARFALAACLLVLPFAVATRRAAVAEEAAAAGKTVLDPESGISETTWPNGLRLLVVPQPENPMVACTIWYSVGSKDEGVGETGLSHYLEHMQFKGTAKYPKGEIDKATQRNGGTNNASTREDATEYHFSFPADRWEVALDIEADRMRNSDVEPAEFEAEKNVVLQELHRNLDDPEDVLYEAVRSAVFRVSGYHHPVIGWPDDVRTTTRERMMAYYRKHYTPDRATLVIVGGVDRGAVIAKVSALFAAIPRGDVARDDRKEPPPLGETRLTLRQDTKVPRLLVAFRALPISDPEEPFLDLLSQILSGDKATRLEKALVDTGLAASASCWNDSLEDDGVFEFLVEPTEGHSVDECETVLVRVLRDLSESGPTADEVARARTKLLAARVFGAETSMGLALRLGSFAVVTDWRYYLRYPAVLASATPESLKALAKKVFRPGFAVVGRSLPKEGPDAVGEGQGGGGQGGTGGGGVRRHARVAGAKGAFSARFRKDGEGAAAVIERALDLKPLREVLPNGLVVLALKRSAAPVFVAQLAVRDGRLGEDVPGLDDFMGALLYEGTTARSGEEVAAAIAAVGGTLSADGGGVTVKTLSKDAKLALDLAFEVATKPAFPAESVELGRAQQVQAIEVELDTPASVGAAALAEAIYGKGHPLGRSVHGTRESVKSITRDHVVKHHSRFFVPGNATLTIVSDRAPEEAVALARAAFGTWEGRPKPAIERIGIPKPAAVSIRKPMAKEQTNTFLGHVGIPRKHPDFTALEVMENVFGTAAGFTDRLSRRIRDEMGLAYTVYGNVTSNAGILPGTFRVYAGTRPEDAAKALDEMRRQVRGILDVPPTPDELEGAKAALRGEVVSGLETAADVAYVLDVCERYQLGFDWPKRHLAEIDAVTAEEVVRAARAHIHPDALVEVVVGPEVPPPGDPSPGNGRK